jgi:predicted TIM-barrel fold metal-dependent hydrolase
MEMIQSTGQESGDDRPDRLETMIDQYHRERSRLAFLDSNMWIGPMETPGFVNDLNLASLRALMKRHDIQGGIVSHFAAKDYDPAWGNARILEAISGTGLWAGIVLWPDMFDEREDGRAYVDRAIQRGARLARIFPRSHHFALADWCSGALLNTLVDYHLPLAVWHTELSWEEIHTLCTTYPDLPVIIEGTPSKVLYFNRIYRPLLRRHSNLYLELHNLSAYLEVDNLARDVSARQLIYGSFLPKFDPNVAQMLVTHAKIPQESKLLIAHQNLLNLVTRIEV